MFVSFSHFCVNKFMRMLDLPRSSFRLASPMCGGCKNNQSERISKCAFLIWLRLAGKEENFVRLFFHLPWSDDVEGFFYFFSTEWQLLWSVFDFTLLLLTKKKNVAKTCWPDPRRSATMCVFLRSTRRDPGEEKASALGYQPSSLETLRDGGEGKRRRQSKKEGL